MPIIRDIIYGAVAHGASLHDLCEKLEIDPADLGNSDQRADFETSCLSWEHAVKVTKDPLLGMHLGESTNPSIMGLVGYLMQNSSTLLDAFAQVFKYGKLATNMFDYRIVEKKDRVILQFIPISMWQRLYPDGARQATEQAMAGTLHVFYLLAGKRISPLNAGLTSNRRKDLPEYERVFRSAITLNNRVGQLIFERDQLLTPVLNHDQSLFRVFEALVREKRKEKSGRSFKSRLRHVMLDEFRGQIPSIEIVASHFNITTRSLQRRLASENTNWRRVSDELKSEIAGKLLVSGSHKVAEVASILGYSGSRSFRRAYKSWTKKTPSAARGSKIW